MIANLARWYLLGCALFEVIPLTCMWAFDAPVHSVFPYAAAHNHNADLRSMVSLSLAILAVVRLGGFFAGRALSASHKWGIVAMHFMELVFIAPMYLANVVPRRKLMPTNKRIEVDFLMCVVALNPLIFAACLRAATMTPRRRDPLEAADAKMKSQ
jgi:hypothetical protein